jgi:sterol desaturase/sphingolipid hydroxylase (fatty acid hydroxylase superfamily)
MRRHWDWFMGLAPWPILYTVTNLAVTTAVAVVYNLVMWPIYAGRVACFEGYRILDKKWQWETDLEEFSRMFKDTWVHMVVNSFIVTPLFMLYNAPDSLLKRAPEEIDEGWTVLLQIYLFQMIESSAFGLVHRVLHQEPFYRHVHKLHH